ncbi:MAG: preprotein translocase subunit SecG [Syntrophaceae bacterium]|nr:preprotein translocase subunit SecG [Syntrophaceae bacterium]
MYTLLIFLHILVCFVLILVVLLQAGKGANMGAAFGGSSQTVFGSSGAGTFLGKMTAAVAVIFMLTSLMLTYMATHRSSSSLMEQKPPVSDQTVPVQSSDAAKVPAPVPSPDAAKVPAEPSAPVNK